MTKTALESPNHFYGASIVRVLSNFIAKNADFNMCAKYETTALKGDWLKVNELIILYGS